MYDEMLKHASGRKTETGSSAERAISARRRCASQGTIYKVHRAPRNSVHTGDVLTTSIFVCCAERSLQGTGAVEKSHGVLLTTDDYGSPVQ